MNKLAKAVLLAASGVLAAPAAQAIPDLPDPNDPGFNLVGFTYADFVAYSLPLLNGYTTADGTTVILDPNNPNITKDFSLQPGDPFNVVSTPGELGKPDKYIVIGTGTNNAGVNSNDDSNVGLRIDDAYRTPDGATLKAFSTCSANIAGNTCPSTDMDNDGTADGVLDPTVTGGGPNQEGNPEAAEGNPPEFFGDLEDSWDANLGDLIAQLDGNTEIHAYFNFNESNQGDTLFGSQFLQVWVRTWITDLTGATVGEWWFADEDSAASRVQDPADSHTDAVTAALASMLPGDGIDGVWGNAFGQVCVDPATGDVDLGCSQGTAGKDVINHNLGADNAAYVVTSPGLNLAVANLQQAGTLSDHVLHVDWRMRWVDNGYEQLFLGSQPASVCVEDCQVSAPASGLLAGTGLLLIAGGFAGRRTSRRLRG